MYFSLLTPIPSAIASGNLAHLGAPYAEHQWLWTFFDKPEGASRPFIYRVSENPQILRDGRRHDDEDTPDIPRVYVVSSMPPAQNRCLGWRVQTRAYAPQVAKGQVLSFELRGNPVVTRASIRNDKTEATRRHEDVVIHAKKALLAARGLKTWAQWQSAEKPSLYDLVHERGSAWLQTQGARLGFELVQPDTLLQADNYQRQVLSSGSNRRGKLAHQPPPIVLSTVDFCGQLVVCDAVTFQQALFTGVGHGKGFGCGLLLVKPAVGE